MTPHLAYIVSYHGILREQYVLRGNGTFRLRYTSARWGVFEYPGTFTRSPSDSTHHELRWVGDARWSGTAILRHDSLFVDYNDVMIHSDFEPGAYAKAPPNE